MSECEGEVCVHLFFFFCLSFSLFTQRRCSRASCHPAFSSSLCELFFFFCVFVCVVCPDVPSVLLLLLVSFFFFFVCVCVCIQKPAFIGPCVGEKPQKAHFVFGGI